MSERNRPATQRFTPKPSSGLAWLAPLAAGALVLLGLFFIWTDLSHPRTQNAHNYGLGAEFGSILLYCSVVAALPVYPIAHAGGWGRVALLGFAPVLLLACAVVAVLVLDL